jgi:hypothetical protein
MEPDLPQRRYVLRYTFSQVGKMTEQTNSRLPQQSAERSHMGNGSGNGQSDSLSVQSAYDWVADTARSNPVLVVGGAVAVGALVVMAVTARKSAPPSRARAFERRIRREIASAEKTLRKSVDRSGFMTGLAELPTAVASRIGTWDAAHLEALKDRASHLAGQLAERASAVMRSRG